MWAQSGLYGGSRGVLPEPPKKRRLLKAAVGIFATGYKRDFGLAATVGLFVFLTRSASVVDDLYGIGLGKTRSESGLSLQHLQGAAGIKEG